jgi:beta-galactosidase
VRATTARDASLVPAGHEVAWEQFRLPYEAPAPLDVTDLPRLRTNQTEQHIEIVGDRFRVVFDKDQGILGSFEYHGTELLADGPEVDFWRAPTDNDLAHGMPTISGAWRSAGRNRKTRSVSVRTIDGGRVEVVVESELPTVRSACWTRYRVHGNGVVLVETGFQPGDASLPELPRFGMTLAVPPAFGWVSWYGRGPHESYWDRKTGAAVGVYSGKVEDQVHAYVRAQENGNKTDVRWVAVYNDEGTGLIAVGQPLLSASVRPYRNEALAYTPKVNKHGPLVGAGDAVTINLDYRQMGVGGDTSWGWRAQAHPEYSLPAHPRVYRFLLRPFREQDGELVDLGRVRLDRVD